MLAQVVGDQVRLESSNIAGVPVHPGDRVSRYVRWPNGTTAEVIALGDWIQVQTGSDLGWVTSRYVTVLADEDDDPVVEPDEELAYVVGAWNLEHLRDGASRGFPENLGQGPTYGDRTAAQYDVIATVIRDEIQAAVLVLNEINGEANGTSAELDRLISKLGSNWRYDLSRSGGRMHVALLYDTQKVRRNTCHEFEIPFREVQGKDIAARDPLGCHFTLLARDGSAQNDLAVIGVHWASGQRNNRNHNEAMAELLGQFAVAFDGDPFDAGERDVVIAGDFNASRYRSPDEDFWEDFGDARWRLAVLAPMDRDDYPGTRLAGFPLRPRSQIDYVMATTVAGGVTTDLVLRRPTCMRSCCAMDSTRSERPSVTTFQ